MLNLRNEVPTPKAGVNAKFVIPASEEPVLTNVLTLTHRCIVRFRGESLYEADCLLSDGLLPFIGFVFQLVALNPCCEQLVGHRQYHWADEDTD